MAPPAFGAHGALADTRALEEQAARNPKKAILDARSQLAAAEKAGDKVARLKALRLLAMAHDGLDDNPGLREASTAGLALAKELGDKAVQVEFMTAQAMSVFNEGRMPE